jgi:hypothetical protein
MLSAASSASFIQNEELALLVRTLGAEAIQLPYMGTGRIRDLH